MILVRSAAVALILFVSKTVCVDVKSLDPKNYQENNNNINSLQSLSRSVQISGGEVLIYSVEHLSCAENLRDLASESNVLCTYTVSPPDRDYNVILSGKDCVGDAPAAASMIHANTDGKVNVAINIKASDLSTDVSQTLDFCIRVDVIENFDGDPHTMDFFITEITIDFNADGTFATDIVSTSSPPRFVDPPSSLLSYGKQYVVEAYQCDEDTNRNEKFVFKDDEYFYLCISTTDPTTKNVRVNELNLFQQQAINGLLKSDPVSDGDINGLTDVDCNAVPSDKQAYEAQFGFQPVPGHICRVNTEFPSQFFEDENAPVVCIGEVELDIRTERRRRNGRYLSGYTSEYNPSDFLLSQNINEIGDTVVLTGNNPTFSTEIYLGSKNSDQTPKKGGFLNFGSQENSAKSQSPSIRNQLWVFLGFVQYAIVSTFMW